MHHPLIAHELSWLDNIEKLYLVEHGPQEVSTAAQQSCQAARDKLGFEVDDFVLVHVGRMRDYKALHESLPVVLEVLREKPNMRLVLAGKVTSVVCRSKWTSII